MKGYIARERGIVVLSKNNTAFPGTGIWKDSSNALKHRLIVQRNNYTIWYPIQSPKIQKSKLI